MRKHCCTDYCRGKQLEESRIPSNIKKNWPSEIFCFVKFVSKKKKHKPSSSCHFHYKLPTFWAKSEAITHQASWNGLFIFYTSSLRLSTATLTVKNKCGGKSTGLQEWMWKVQSLCSALTNSILCLCSCFHGALCHSLLHSFFRSLLPITPHQTHTNKCLKGDSVMWANLHGA